MQFGSPQEKYQKLNWGFSMLPKEKTENLLWSKYPLNLPKLVYNTCLIYFAQPVILPSAVIHPLYFLKEDGVTLLSNQVYLLIKTNKCGHCNSNREIRESET